MPRSREPDRPKPPSSGDAHPPQREEVERAIRSVVERLKPKARKDAPEREI